MDNDNDISIMRAESRGVVFENHEDEISRATWANETLADLLKLTANRRKHFEPVEYRIETREFELCPPITAYYENAELLPVIEEAVDELLPWVTALIEIRHQLRKGKR